MKSEHRHALQTNDLSRLAMKIGRYFENYGAFIFWGLIALLLVVAAVVYWNRTATASARAGWTEFATAAATGTAEDFANVADKYPGTAVGHWARLSEAESYLQSAVDRRFSDGEAGIRDLEKAEKSFETLVRDANLSDAVRERALFGLGKARESLGKVDEAAEAYGELAGNPKFSGSVFQRIAAERKEVLQTGRTREFYAWFQKQKPEPEDRSGPQDGTPALPPGHPPFGAGEITPQLPGLPDSLQLPLTGDDDAEPAPAGAPQLPTLPATDDTATDDLETDDTPTPEAADSDPADGNAEAQPADQPADSDQQQP